MKSYPVFFRDYTTIVSFCFGGWGKQYHILIYYIYIPIMSFHVFFNCFCCHVIALWVPISGSAYLGGGFKYFLFSPLFGEDSHFD